MHDISTHQPSFRALMERGAAGRSAPDNCPWGVDTCGTALLHGSSADEAIDSRFREVRQPGQRGQCNCSATRTGASRRHRIRGTRHDQGNCSATQDNGSELSLHENGTLRADYMVGTRSTIASGSLRPPCSGKPTAIGMSAGRCFPGLTPHQPARSTHYLESNACSHRTQQLLAGPTY